MSNLFRPDEAKEDQFVLLIVAAILFAGLVSMFAAATWQSGMKYLVLQIFSEETQADIFAIALLEPAPSLSEGGQLELNTNLYRELLEVFVEYRLQDGAAISASFLALPDEAAWQVGSQIPIRYSRLRNDLFLPVDQLPAYRVDAWIAVVATVLIIAALLTVPWSGYRWFVFRKRPRH